MNDIERKIPSNEGVEFRGGKVIGHVKPAAEPAYQNNQSNGSTNNNQGSSKK